MSREPDCFEERLSDGLTRLAGQATASADAFERIEAGLVVHRRPRPEPHRLGRTPRRHPPRRGRLALVPATGMALVLVITAVVAARSAQRSNSSVVVVPPAAPHVRTPGSGADSMLPRVSPNVGSLAFLAEHGLTVATPDRLPVDFSAKGIANPHWSADGRYLSYTIAATGGGPEELHIASTDGSVDRTVAHGHFFATAWSGVGHQLAALPEAHKGVGGLLLFPPEGVPHQLVSADVKVFSFAWSSRGTALAYSAVGLAGGGDEVRTVDTDTGVQTKVAVGPRGAGILLARWWPDDKGLLWWIDPDHSLKLEAEGLMLQTSSVLGPVRDVGPTIVYPPWLAFSPDGKTLALVAGAGMLPWKGKRLVLCDPVGATCTPIASPAGTVALDPSWSPDGHHLAFVVAAAEGTPGAGSSVNEWYPSRRLWTADADGSRGAEVPGTGGGVSGPSWSSSGEFLRYSTATGVEVVPAGGGAPSTVVTGLTGGTGAGPDGFGKVPWRGRALWAN